MATPIVFLVDNGSLRAQAVIRLRVLAQALSERIQLPVEPVSLLHSCKVPIRELAGVPATIVKRRLREYLDLGMREFICVPLFLGPSLAISEYLPRLIEEFKQEYPDLNVRIAPVLAGVDLEAPDRRLAQILAQQVRALWGEAESRVALVDHGSPIVEVNRVRNVVAGQLAEELELSVGAVLPCSMERRPGAAYAFNDPLLQDLGQINQFAGGRLVLAMFFLLPGRHAGLGGDVADICDQLLTTGAFEQIETTPLLGEHSLLMDILEDRFDAVWYSAGA
ncbi:CbiX/SirB N-terminal domain-containing protein [Coraliomargarita sp. SDUM461004]|uniref:CbiX/SirB N-terminal domain-containing protein n=1 Tax=Thalassobacterium sedimentorum TaxID=3041258 RepID=A0ABU1AML6_9BACT|nr:CbiX/SirB N-terminal domain-containing protein [Coraliomargarita sp. SDUM461004]MDQ8196033.1 CbiX/SirB N-terminal domain-containing protein [Coraliomargarita sp. SDUM461004]